MENGTLYQMRMRNVTNWRNVKKQVKSVVKDFLELCVTGYFLVAVMSFLGMTAVRVNCHSRSRRCGVVNPSLLPMSTASCTTERE